MFESLMAFWKGKDFLTEVLEEFKEMLNDTKRMFVSVCGALIKGRGGPDLEDRIYKIDKRVNRLEREIRKRIVEHLSIRPGTDVPVSLVLMSVVKDAERVGDYCKNLLEITKLLDKPIEKNRFRELFNGIDKKILETFEMTEKAFIESDEEVAKQLMYLEREIVKNCDEIVEKTAKGSLSANEAVCFALLARYFKRVAAHLANIGSSVILPISDLDFFDEKLRREQG